MNTSAWLWICLRKYPWCERCLVRREEGGGPSTKDRSNSFRTASYSTLVSSRAGGSPSASQSDDILERRGTTTPSAAGGRIVIVVSSLMDVAPIGVGSGSGDGRGVSGLGVRPLVSDDSAHAASHKGLRMPSGTGSMRLSMLKKNPPLIVATGFGQLVDVSRQCCGRKPVRKGLWVAGSPHVGLPIWPPRLPANHTQGLQAGFRSNPPTSPIRMLR